MSRPTIPAAPVVELRQITNRFGDHIIHEHLDLEIRAGETLAVVGGSGSGKTTLLRTMILLSRPNDGQVRLFGADALDLGEDEEQRLRTRLGVMFQQGALFSSLTVLENVTVPLTEHTLLPTPVVRELALLKLGLVGLEAEAAGRYPRELSGGMLKRAAVARALALDPEIVFLDEPTAGLDPVSANAFDELIVQLKETLGLTVVIVTHDLDTLWHATDRVAYLAERRVVAVAPVAELADHAHAQIAAYFGGPRGRAARTAA
ncbi:MAG: ATP-binding cassette domain-containing protein [Gammaproteobacteria bacterium]|nr:ATP-binding cassette domain-containing protein [Gammaproteobacteria bacterium]